MSELKVDAAAEERRRRRREVELAAEEATIRGILLAALRAGSILSLHLAHGRQISGRVNALGSDCVELVDRLDAFVTVRLSAISTLEPLDVDLGFGVPDTGDEDGGVHGFSLHESMAGAVGSLIPVTFDVGRADMVEGIVIGCGLDVVVLRLGGPTGPVAYVVVDSVKASWTSSAL